MPKPAATLAHHHVCASAQHSGTTIVGPGADRVLLEGAPAARFTDSVACGGGPNAISSGNPTVFWGGLPAAVGTDVSQHGGTIVNGCATIAIGDAPPWVSVVRRGKCLVIVDRRAKRITITGTQEYSGSGASPEFIATAIEQIRRVWSGPTTFEGEPYTTDCLVVGRAAKDPRNPTVLRVEVRQTSDWVGVTSATDPSRTQIYGDRDGYQHSTDLDNQHTVAAHEFGHTLGLPDEYQEGPRNPDGTRNIVHSGQDNALMNSVDVQARPTAQNFQDLVTGENLLPEGPPPAAGG